MQIKRTVRLTEAECKKIVMLAESGMPLNDIADKIGRSPGCVRRVVRERTDIRPPSSSKAPYTPTEEEIAAGVEEIRCGWSEEERVRHSVVKEDGWMPPVVSMAGLPRKNTNHKDM